MSNSASAVPLLANFPEAPSSGKWTLTARWVFPVSSPPLANGVVTIEGGRIVAVEPAGTHAADLDLGNVAIVPGFVNCHTHLDLSDAAGQCPPGPDFVGWLEKVIAHRRSQTPEGVDRAIEMGIAQSLRHGVTFLGDISVGGRSWERLSVAATRSVVFHEMIGLSKERGQQAWLAALAWLNEHPYAENCQRALSPHAPYSVNAKVFEQLGYTVGDPQVTCAIDCPVAIHLAESREESQLIEGRFGPFVDFLKRLGAWDESGLIDSFDDIPDYASHLYIHANYLRRRKLRGTVVYCPRTHAAFGHPPHPFREFLGAGTPVALGTDSLASNPDLSILAEARFVRRLHPDFSCEHLLRMSTLSGAEALGWADETGSLIKTKSADLVVLPLPDMETSEPHQLLFDSELTPRAVLFRGQWTVGGIEGMVKKEPSHTC